VHLHFQIFFPGVISLDPIIKGRGGKGGQGKGGEETGGEGREGRGWDRVNPRKQILATALAGKNQQT
jgi:hypothetical protein